MLRVNTPIEDYRERYGLWVKREDLSCPPPGPAFSKTRGVYARVASREEKTIGVLDTYHSQAGHAVARACQVLGKKCINYYPNYKHEPGPRDPQRCAEVLGASLYPLPAGRSCILYHAAKKHAESVGAYLMPNALKLEESVAETAREVPLGHAEWEDIGDGPRPAWVVIPASSGTIAAGVIRGFGDTTEFIVHLGYSRSHSEVDRYLREKSGYPEAHITLIDEGFSYKDRAKPGETPPWPCNEYYDLKAFRWWMKFRQDYPGDTLFWNIG
jgi:hypothetical protein